MPACRRFAPGLGSDMLGQSQLMEADMANAGNGDDLHKGLKNMSPKQMEAGDPKPPSRSVNDGAVRSSTAPTPKTLGGRTA